jgi:Domain of unknown function (DUF4190)
MTGPSGASGESGHDPANRPQQPGWTPPWDAVPNYPPGYPQDYPEPYPQHYQQPYPQPQFGPAAPGYGWGPTQPAAHPGTNGLAIASLITAFAGLLCCIVSVVAIVLGTVALDQIKRTRQDGFGLAVAGIAIGVAGLLIHLILMLFVLRAH